MGGEFLLGKLSNIVMPKAKEETPTKKLKKSIMPSELVAEKMASVATKFDENFALHDVCVCILCE